MKMAMALIVMLAASVSGAVERDRNEAERVPDRASLCSLLLQAAKANKPEAFEFLHTTYKNQFPDHVLGVSEVTELMRATQNRAMLDPVLRDPRIHTQISPQGKSIVDIADSVSNPTAQQIFHELGIKRGSIDLGGLDIRSVIKSLKASGLGILERRLVLTTNLIDKDSVGAYWQSKDRQPIKVEKSKLINWALEHNDLVMLRYLAKAKQAVLNVDNGTVLFNYLVNWSGISGGNINFLLESLPILKINWSAYYNFMAKEAPSYAGRDSQGYMQFGLPSLTEVLAQFLRKFPDKDFRAAIGLQFLMALMSNGYELFPPNQDGHQATRVLWGLDALDPELISALIENDYPNKSQVLAAMKGDSDFMKSMEEKLPVATRARLQ